MEHKLMSEQEWNLLPANLKRVEIAKDVLLHLQSGLIRRGCGTYLHIDNIREYDGERELRDVLSTEGARCEVCAKGALFIADVMRRDNFKVEQYPSNNSGKEPLILDKLSDYFDVEQLHLIESAYEVGKMSTNDSAKADDAIRFGLEFESKIDRLVAIMNNMIKNNGDFIPTQVEETTNV